MTSRPSPGRPQRIRTAARALVIEQGRLLVVTMADEKGPFALLPGGGQQPGETLFETLRRECREELGCRIDPLELLYLREYRGANHEFRERHRHFHQIEAVFRARLRGRPCPAGGDECDKRQTGVAWIPLADLAHWRLYPAVLKKLLGPEGWKEDPAASRYLGDIN